jgi:hypothetical protein
LIRQIRLTTKERRKKRTEIINKCGLSGIVVAVGVEYREKNERNDDNGVWISRSKRLLSLYYYYYKSTKYGSCNEEYNLKYELRKRGKKSKAVPVTGHGGLYGCEMLRIPHCIDSWLMHGGKVVSPTHRPHFTPQKYFFLCFRYSLLLEAE